MTPRPVLRAGALALHLAPHAGGSIARFDRIDGAERQPLLRGTDEEGAGPLASACFPLVPYCNRIRGGRFTCAGREILLAQNLRGDASPLHGQGWLMPWDLVACSDDTAELHLHHPAGEWPWAYEAVQRFTLDADGLSIMLSCRNRSDTPMPCGLGLHPYYPCDAATRLDTAVEAAWTVDADILPVERVPARGRYDLRQRAICGQQLDNGFEGWGGVATIDWRAGGHGLRLSSPDAHYFQVYSPAEGGLFVAEPVQHANAALNAPEVEWARLGITMLAPGEILRLTARFDVLAPTGR